MLHSFDLQRVSSGASLQHAIPINIDTHTHMNNLALVNFTLSHHYSLEVILELPQLRHDGNRLRLTCRLLNFGVLYHCQLLSRPQSIHV